MSVKNRKGGGIKVFMASIVDINKALRVRSYIDPKTKLLAYLYYYLLVFDRKVVDKLPPFRGLRVSYRIKLERDDNGREPEVL